MIDLEVVVERGDETPDLPIFGSPREELGVDKRIGGDASTDPFAVEFSPTAIAETSPCEVEERGADEAFVDGRLEVLLARPKTETAFQNE